MQGYKRDILVAVATLAIAGAILYAYYLGKSGGTQASLPGTPPQMQTIRPQQAVPSVAPQGVAPAQPMQVTTVPQQRPGTVSEETARAMLEARVMPRSATTDGKTPPPMRSLADTKADAGSDDWHCVSVDSAEGDTRFTCLRRGGDQ